MGTFSRILSGWILAAVSLAAASEEPPIPWGVYTDGFWMFLVNTTNHRGGYGNLGIEFPFDRRADLNVEAAVLVANLKYFSLGASHVDYQREDRSGWSMKLDLIYTRVLSTENFGPDLYRVLYSVRYSHKLSPIFISPEGGLGIIGDGDFMYPWVNLGVRVTYRRID